MNIKVMKFGGSSISSELLLKHAMKKVIDQVNMGFRVLVVVSAMGRNGDRYATDSLLGLVHDYISLKERDRLMSVGEIISSIVMSDALNAAGIASYALGNEECGLVSDDRYGNATIQSTDGGQIKALFRLFRVVVAPGFQAHTKDFHVTTLGRGGSDYSAMLYAVMLGQRDVMIYTDVDGVYGSDPKKFPESRRYEEMHYEDIIRLVENGAKVMHLQSLYYARDNGLRICIGSTFSSRPGTWIV